MVLLNFQQHGTMNGILNITKQLNMMTNGTYCHDFVWFSHQNACFSHPWVYMPFLTMKMTESAKIALQYGIIDFNKEKV